MKFAVAAMIGMAGAFTPAETEEVFLSYISQYGKSYATKAEYDFRLKIFADNLQVIADHNMQATQAESHVLGINYMTDWTPAEFKKMLGYKPHLRVGAHKQRKHHNKTVHDVPASLDWRDKGAVTPVKNQGSCGSCWAFSSTGAMEGAYFMKTQQLVSMSEQQLVDCSTAQGNEGCNGGLMDQAFTYLENNALDTEASYPYKGRDGTCAAQAGAAVTKTTGFHDVTVNSPSALLEAVQHGPVAVAVDASVRWQFYLGGIVEYLCGTNLDHGVLLVGYGVAGNGEKYWIVKNSWGAMWGEKGYIRIHRDDTEGKPGACGIQMAASYPLV